MSMKAFIISWPWMTSWQLYFKLLSTERIHWRKALERILSQWLEYAMILLTDEKN